MSVIHVSNTDFEFELSDNKEHQTIHQVWHRYQMCLQLQYLPLLYADENDWIAVTNIPALDECAWRQGEGLPKFYLLQQNTKIPHLTCLSWGASSKVQKWTSQREINYPIPPLDIVREINSKEFSFQQSKPLDHSALIWNEEELKKNLNHITSKCVLKTCFGVSGKGHYFIDENSIFDKVVQFCLKEWQKGLPLVLEPWKDRIFDFSTQWYIDPEKGVQLVGPTVFESNSKGVYQATLAGEPEKIFGKYFSFLDEHCQKAKEVLQIAWRKGYFGFVGVDAFLYQENDQILLHPVVEVNGRQTMSLAALKFQRKYFSQQSIRLFFKLAYEEGTNLLPERLSSNHAPFSRLLAFKII